MPNNSLTFTAQFEPITYYATFTAEGVEIGRVPFTVETDNMNAPDVPKKEGYTGAWSEYMLATSDITVNAIYTVNKYTASYLVDGEIISTEDIEFGSSIVQPDNPQKAGYIFREWLPEIPETMPARDISFYAVFDEIQKPVITTSVSIKNYTNVRTVDYKTTITFTALTDSIPEGARVVWYKDGQRVAEGEKYTVKEATEAFNVQVRLIDESGNALGSSETELVKVKTDFFSKIIAFFRMLFGSLPKIQQ